MRAKPFEASQFAATQWNTADDKAAFGNAYLNFVESEWKRSLFTKGFYQRLSNCFGHIAHYVESVIMRSLGVIRRVDTAFKRPSTLHNCNRSWLYAARGLRIVGESRQTLKS